MGSGSRNSPPFTRNERMPTRRTRTRMVDQRKDRIDPVGPHQRNRPKQLQTHYLSTDGEENIKSKKKKKKREEIYYSIASCVLFPEEQKGCRKGSRGTIELLYIDQHILNESKTRPKI